MNPPETGVTQGVHHAWMSKSWKGTGEARQALDLCMTGENSRSEHKTDRWPKL